LVIGFQQSHGAEDIEAKAEIAQVFLFIHGVSVIETYVLEEFSR
tara:strand:- start:1353 stop:1484 length:132 start_codon:yes stop_codon:yes gene_type:complete